MTPVFKKGKRSEAGNYRPISLTCIACKIMEHILVSNIIKHANRNNILYHLQYGFREKRSCETQLLEFVHDFACNMQGVGQTDVLIMDFSKAFDKVAHQRLIRKLGFYGVTDKTRDWIQAELSKLSLKANFQTLLKCNLVSLKDLYWVLVFSCSTLRICQKI